MRPVNQGMCAQARIEHIIMHLHSQDLDYKPTSNNWKPNVTNGSTSNFFTTEPKQFD